MLVFKDRQISTDIFRNLPAHLPEGSRLVLNETKVIPARLILNKPSGARIEIFCLEPSGLVSDYQLALQQGPGCEWKCYIGNARRWKSDCIEGTVQGPDIHVKLSARKVSSHDDHYIVRFEWAPSSLSFSEILAIFGKIPLPPYIHRDSEEEDKSRYQTVFARSEGSVAAPTAGLHFTEEVLNALRARNIDLLKINLHVGAGTFKPVSSENLSGHAMHSEYVDVTTSLIRDFLNYPDRPTVAVGTTTVRTLESLYWQGAKWLKKKPRVAQMDIRQWDPYEFSASDLPPVKEALETVLYYIDKERTGGISGYTSLFIAPGYPYRIPDAMITNFHLPQSTLLLLVSAFIGNVWKDVYQYALEKNFRFLSYGDSCLFFREHGS